jgi:hypothetical protein
VSVCAPVGWKRVTCGIVCVQACPALPLHYRWLAVGLSRDDFMPETDVVWATVDDTTGAWVR